MLNSLKFNKTFKEAVRQLLIMRLGVFTKIKPVIFGSAPEVE